MSKPNVVWMPQEGPQTEFHQRPEFEALYGGARGGGKTDSLLAEGLRQIHNPNYRAIFFRRTFPRLQEAMDRAQAIFPRVAPGARWDGEGKRWIFPSGAMYRFAHLQNPGDQENYQGFEYQYIAFDELTQFFEKMYTDMLGSCRSKDPSLITYVRSSANPGGVGHSWVKERFIDVCPPVNDGPRRYEEALGVWWQPMKPGRTYVDPQTGLDRIYVPSRVFDNRILLEADPGYVRRLLALPEETRRAWLEGDWDVFEGRVYSEFRRDVHVVEPYKIPDSWPRIRVIDTGYTNPTAVTWAAVDPDGRIVFYDEHYEAQQPISYHAEIIHQKSGGADWSGRTVMDPAADQRTAASEKSAMMQYAQHGIRAQKAINAVWPGIQKVKEYLQEDEAGFPRLFVFSTCVNLIKEFMEYQWDPQATTHGAPKETPLKVRDHLMDCVRYTVQHVPRVPGQPKSKHRKPDRQPPRRRILDRAAGY